MPPSKLTFVSVFFESEIPLLLLQARSVALFLPETLVASIVAIDNTSRGINDRVREQLLREYGAHSSRVRFLRPDDISPVPGTTGWRSQQILKLAVADQIDTAQYVVLDAKNHFVGTPRADDFVTPSGLARVKAHGFTAHPLRVDLERVLDYLDLDVSRYVDRFPATATPFVFQTEVVGSMMRDIEARSGNSFAHEFISNDLTEFFLYSGWIVADGRSWEDVYEFEDVFWPAVWPRRANAQGVREAVLKAREQQTPLFAVHRRALLRLDQAGVEELASYWAGVGLFGSEQEAARFVASFKKSCARAERRSKARDFPYRVKTVLRRRVRSLRSPVGEARG